MLLLWSIFSRAVMFLELLPWTPSTVFFITRLPSPGPWDLPHLCLERLLTPIDLTHLIHLEEVETWQTGRSWEPGSSSPAVLCLIEVQRLAIPLQNFEILFAQSHFLVSRVICLDHYHPGKSSHISSSLLSLLEGGFILKSLHWWIHSSSPWYGSHPLCTKAGPDHDDSTPMLHSCILWMKLNVLLSRDTASGVYTKDFQFDLIWSHDLTILLFILQMVSGELQMVWTCVGQSRRTAEFEPMMMLYVFIVTFDTALPAFFRSMTSSPV